MRFLVTTHKRAIINGRSYDKEKKNEIEAKTFDEAVAIVRKNFASAIPFAKETLSPNLFSAQWRISFELENGLSGTLIKMERIDEDDLSDWLKEECKWNFHLRL